MAENIIKDFVKKQTTPLTIGVPKQRPQSEPEAPVTAPVEKPAPVAETVQVQAPAPEAVQAAPQADPEISRGHVGRPKSDIEKVKLSVYVPSDMKARLIKVQHHNYKPSINEVLIEAIADLLKKYGE